MKKIGLEKIEVSSFVTTFNDENKKTVKGENGHKQNALADTSKIQQCTPHGSVANCPPTFFPCNPIDDITVWTVNNTILSFCRCSF